MPNFHIQAMDKARYVFETAKAPVGKIPSEMGIEDAELIAVIDAMNRYIVANPSLDPMTIDVVDDDK